MLIVYVIVVTFQKRTPGCLRLAEPWGNWHKETMGFHLTLLSYCLFSVWTVPRLSIFSCPLLAHLLESHLLSLTTLASNRDAKVTKIFYHVCSCEYFFHDSLGIMDWIQYCAGDHAVFLLPLQSPHAIKSVLEGWGPSPPPPFYPRHAAQESTGGRGNVWKFVTPFCGEWRFLLLKQW